MYRLVSENNNITTIQLMTALNDFYSNSENWTVNIFRDILGADPVRGKELFIERDSRYYSMTSSIYDFINTDNVTNLVLPTDGTGYIGTGNFSVYLNTNFESFKNSWNQDGNYTTVNTSRHSSCNIPRENDFNYRFFTTEDEYDFILEITFGIYRFFVIWGDCLKGQLDINGNPSGQYAIGHISEDQQNLRIALQTDLNDDRLNVSARRLTRNNLYTLSDTLWNFRGNVLYYDNLNALVPATQIPVDVASNCGNNNFNTLQYSDNILNSLNDDFFGNESFINYNLYVEYDTDDARHLKTFDFGFCKSYNFFDGEIVELPNNRKFEVLYFLTNNKDVTFDSPFTKGMAFWIERGDL